MNPSDHPDLIWTIFRGTGIILALLLLADQML